MAMAHKQIQRLLQQNIQKKKIKPIWEFGKLKQQHIKLVG